jgi:hypothetical protein
MGGDMAWLISDRLMNSLCSQEPVEESLVDICLDGKQSAPWSGNPTQQAYCAPDKMTDFSRLSRYGMTYKPLTASRGEELLTLFLEGFHAKTSAQQGEVMDLMEKDQECGEKWRGWLAKYDHNTSLWRTAQCSLLEDLNESLETLPRWGMTVNGLLWEQPTLERRIKGTESGLWATPTRCDYKGTTGTANFQSRKKQFNDLTGGMVTGTIYPNPITYEVMMGWPLGWTDLKPLVMDKSHSVQQVHGEFLEVNNG